MAFRKVDVDPFNDEDEKWIDSTASMSLASGASDSEIRSALARCVPELEETGHRTRPTDFTG